MTARDLLILGRNDRGLFGEAARHDPVRRPSREGEQRRRWDGRAPSLTFVEGWL
jgi:hypothetical protein